MRRLLFLLFLCATYMVQAQDVIITKEGDALKVYKLEVASETVFYQTSEADNAPIQRMAKADILMIKFKDGRKLIIGEEEQTQPTVQPQTPLQNKVQPTNSQDVADPMSNAQVLRRYQSMIEYTGKPSNTKANLVLINFSPVEGSVMADQNVEVEIIANCGWSRKGKWYEGVSGIWSTTLLVKNKSTKTIYLDLGNCFIIRGGESVPFYVPTITSSTLGTSRGGSVNLGAVAGAMGVGGALGTLANGINLGGSNSQSTTTTVLAQRIVPIPPTSTKELEKVSLMNLMANNNPFPNAPFAWNRFKGMAYMVFNEPVQTGQVIDYEPNANTIQFGFILGYAEDEAQSNPHSLHATFGLSRVIGLPQKASSMYNWVETSGIDKTVDPNYHNQPHLLLRQKEE